MAERIENADGDGLSVAERMILVQDIWDSIAADQGQLDLSRAEKAELDGRMKEHLESPGEGSSWEQVVKRLSLG